MTTQKEIDAMLDDSWCASSTLNHDNQVRKSAGLQADRHEASYDKFKESKDEYGEE